MNNKQELDIMERFDSYIKKCIRNFAFNYTKKNCNKWNRNAVYDDDFYDFDSGNINCDNPEDYYFKKGKIYDVKGILIKVTDSKIIEALEQLPCESRDIILLYYFEDETDMQIAKMLNSIQQTINRRRKAALELMKKIIVNADE